MMNEKNLTSRRNFIRTVTGVAVGAPLLLDAVFAAVPAKKLRHACIGVGGMGGHDLQNFISHPNVEIVALCDVDENHLKKAAELLPNARIYRDWRDLLKKEKNNIDSVNVTVPDHNHFIIAMAAIEMGKHVYCQKPMCHDVAEVRVLTEAAIKKGVVTQLGTQIASSIGDRTAVQWIKEGIIGKVKHAYLCSNRSGIAGYRLEGPRPTNKQEIPASLDWEKWLGTAPERPYATHVYHPGIWRTWQDFGTGWSGDIGCHIFDAVWKGLGLKAPLNVKAKVQQSWKDSAARQGDTWPQSNHITWTFPGNAKIAGSVLPLEWFDGEFYPPEEVRALFNNGEKYPEEAAMLIGTEGALLIPHGGTPVLLPESKFSTYNHPKLEERNHYHHYVDGCLGKAKPESHFAQSGPMTEAILLGTVALRVPDTLLEWDAVNMKIPNNPAAEKYLKRKYRKGWEVKGFS
ncbi:Gfo/Idh/MocA family protein [Sphingobacterium sp. HJSM2_6]|uniref:Gfo/Idh/MocA family protein n=1 Tax=Sphingobacterium sp. HJSM2_6 TaxID=3366264 RepID=UPI003BD2CC54